MLNNASLLYKSHSQFLLYICVFCKVMCTCLYYPTFTDVSARPTLCLYLFSQYPVLNLASKFLGCLGALSVFLNAYSCPE